MSNPKKVPFDKFQAPLEFNIHGDTSLKTWTGFVLTLIFIGLIGSVFLILVVQLGSHQNYKLASSTDFTKQPSITLGNYYIGVQIATFPNADTPIVLLSEAEINSEVHPLLSSMLTPCTNYELSNWFQGEMNLPGYQSGLTVNRFCFSDPNYELSGTETSANFKVVQFQIDTCYSLTCKAAFNGTTNQTAFILFYTLDGYVNPAIYNTPFQTFVNAEIGSVYFGSSNAYSTSLARINIETDDGFIYPQVTEETHLTADVWQRTPLPSENNAQISWTLVLSAKRYIYQRTYAKIQEILAEVLGLSTTIGLIVGLILSPYLTLKKEERMVIEVYRHFGEKISRISVCDYLRAKILKNPEQQTRLKELNEKYMKITRALDISKIAKMMIQQEESASLINHKDCNESITQIKGTSLQESLEINQISPFPPEQVTLNVSNPHAEIPMVSISL